MVLVASSPENLSTQVNDLLAENGEVTFVGGVSVSGYAYSYENSRKGYTETEIDVTYAQAVVVE